MDRQKELLLELTGLIYDLDKNPGEDWFLSFAGHVDTVSVHFYRIKPAEFELCGNPTKETVWVTHGVSLGTITPLKNLIKEVSSYLPNN